MVNRTHSRRILVIKTRAIGDTVLLTGILKVLRKHKPYHEIDVVTRSPGGVLLENLPFVNRVICITESKGKLSRFLYWGRLIRRLRGNRYEYVLNFHASDRTGFFSRLIRAKYAVVNDHDLHSYNIFSELEVPNRGIVKSIIDRDLDVLRAIGINSEAIDALPFLKLNKQEIEWGESQIQERKLQGKGPQVFLGIGASRETKKWPVGHYYELMKLLSSSTDAKFIIGITDDDQEWITPLLKKIDENSNLKSKTAVFKNIQLRYLTSLVAASDLFIGNDSGIKHIAAAIGLPTYTFFGPELPFEWHPYPQDRHKIGFIEGLACRTPDQKHWCSIPVCTTQEHQCMVKITPEHVLKEVMDLIQNHKKQNKLGI